MEELLVECHRCHGSQPLYQTQLMRLYHQGVEQADMLVVTWRLCKPCVHALRNWLTVGPQ